MVGELEAAVESVTGGVVVLVVELLVVAPPLGRAEDVQADRTTPAARKRATPFAFTPTRGR